MIPSTYLNLFIAAVAGVLIIVLLFAAMRRKYKICAVLCIILCLFTGFCLAGRKVVSYERAPGQDIPILSVSITDDGVFYQGKKLNIVKQQYSDTDQGVCAYRVKYRLFPLSMFKPDEPYVYYLNLPQ